MGDLRGCPPHYPLKFKCFVIVTEFFLGKKGLRGNSKYKISEKLFCPKQGF